MDTLAETRLRALDAPKRNYYFYGKLLDELHLRLEQEYVNRKRWMLSRLALGYGVLCGLQIAKDDKHVVVDAGVAIDRYGREIVVPERVHIDLSKISADCVTARDRLPAESPVFLWLCYRECKADFMPALVTDCKPQHCAPSTIVESYCFEVRTEGPLAIEAEDKALCDALHDGKNAEEQRKLIDIALQRECARGGGDGCIALAKIELDADGVVITIDLTPQQRVYSNDTLFKMLLCRHIEGKGPKGDPGANGAPGADGAPGPQGPAGPGLNPDLPKILDIGWKHNASYFYWRAANNPGPGSFLEPFFDGSTFAAIDVLEKRLIDGSHPPLFTVYFNRSIAGLDDQTFTLRLQFELMVAQQQGVMRPGFYLELPLVGQILQEQGAAAARTPQTAEPYAFAASFVPSQEAFTKLLPAVLLLLAAASLRADKDTLALATLQVKLKGDFLFAADNGGNFKEDLALDGDNIGGQVGIDRTRGAAITGGKNPSGNRTQGGDFESWLRLALSEKTAGMPAPDPVRVAAIATAVRNRPEDLPVSLNLASSEQLESAGFSRAQATRILEARRQGFFSQEADVVTRARVTADRVRVIGERIVL